MHCIKSYKIELNQLFFFEKVDQDRNLTGEAVERGKLLKIGCYSREQHIGKELGLDINFNEMRPIITINSQHVFDDIYVVKAKVDINQLNLQKEEVKAVMWADQELIIDMINDKWFVPYHKSLIELLFAMRKERGSHDRE